MTLEKGAGADSSLVQTIQDPRYEDYEIQYQNGRNMWAFLGMGLTRESKTPGADLSPYLNVKEIDPKWLEAIGADSDAPRKASIEELSKSKSKAFDNGRLGLQPINVEH